MAGTERRVGGWQSGELAGFVGGITAYTASLLGLLESFIDAPRLTAWNTWMFGMGSWIVLTFVFRRKLT